MALEAPPASSPAVHNVMIANTSKDTKPELRVRRMLREAGYPGYRLHWRIDDEDGRYVCRPDITYPGKEACDIRPRVLLAQVSDVRPRTAEDQRRLLAGEVREERREGQEEGERSSGAGLGRSHNLGV